MRDGVRLSTQELSAATESGETAVSAVSAVSISNGGMLVELLQENKLSSCAVCVREWDLLHEHHVCGRNVSVTFVKCQLISGGRCSILDSYERALKNLGFRGPKIVIGLSRECAPVAILMQRGKS